MKILQNLLAAILLAATSVTVLAQGYPNKPIRIVVPFAPGGGGDVVGRIITAKMTESMGQQVLLDNRAGAAGAIGGALVASAAPDGYTLLLAEDSVLGVLPQLQKLSFDPQNFTPISLIANSELVLVVHPSVPATNLREFIALVKQNPGKYSYASTGTGSMHHLAMEALKTGAGLDIVHVPYKGSGPALVDLVSGQIPIAYSGLAQTLPFIKSGKIRMIAAGGTARLKDFPNVDLIADAVPGFNGNSSWSLLGPAGLSPELVARLNSEIKKVVNDPAIAAQMNNGALTPIGSSPQELRDHLKSSRERWGKVIAETGVKLD